MPVNVKIVYQSRVMAELIRRATRYASSSATVLVTGESGTGKELIAEHIHRSSTRTDHGYIRVNCAALSESLLESELFGHERGAFTGAMTAREGRFETADGGTLLLDEITEVPLSFQSKLLRVLEQSEFERVGGNHTQSVDVRVVATTNRSIEDEVAAGRFRADLYHRLNVLRLRMPPLRERREDVPLLTTHFVNRFRHEACVELRGFSGSGMRVLSDYYWPGNVRQLKNVVHRACVLADTPLMGVSELPRISDVQTNDRGGNDQFDVMPLDEIERLVILKRLEHFNGNKTAAAGDLGVSPRTLSNKLTRYREEGQLKAA